MARMHTTHSKMKPPKKFNHEVDEFLRQMTGPRFLTFVRTKNHTPSDAKGAALDPASERRKSSFTHLPASADEEAKLPPGIPPKRRPQFWSVDEVSQFVTAIGLGHIAALIHTENIDGMALTCMPCAAALAVHGGVPAALRRRR